MSQAPAVARQGRGEPGPFVSKAPQKFTPARRPHGRGLAGDVFSPELISPSPAPAPSAQLSGPPDLWPEGMLGQKPPVSLGVDPCKKAVRGRLPRAWVDVDRIREEEDDHKNEKDADDIDNGKHTDKVTNPAGGGGAAATAAAGDKDGAPSPQSASGSDGASPCPPVVSGFCLRVVFPCPTSAGLG
jgi:hypothetical protein